MTGEKRLRRTGKAEGEEFPPWEFFGRTPKLLCQPIPLEGTPVRRESCEARQDRCGVVKHASTGRSCSHARDALARSGVGEVRGLILSEKMEEQDV